MEASATMSLHMGVTMAPCPRLRTQLICQRRRQVFHHSHAHREGAQQASVRCLPTLVTAVASPGVRSLNRDPGVSKRVCRELGSGGNV